MYRLFNMILADGLTPNGLYVLLLLERKEIPKEVNFTAEMRLLKLNGFLHESGASTEKGEEIIKKYNNLISGKTTKKKEPSTEVNSQLVAEYRELFPKGTLPSGQPARNTVKELEKKFAWFFETHKYDWDTVLKATKKYIEKYAQEGYMYMKTSGYFISKAEKGAIVSTLASYCDMVLDGDNDDKNYTSHDVI